MKFQSVRCCISKVDLERINYTGSFLIQFNIDLPSPNQFYKGNKIVRNGHLLARNNQRNQTKQSRIGPDRKKGTGNWQLHKGTDFNLFLTENLKQNPFQNIEKTFNPFSCILIYILTHPPTSYCTLTRTIPPAYAPVLVMDRHP